MSSSTAAMLCTYHYDPLDRLAAVSPAGLDDLRRFYRKNRLTTEIQGQILRAMFQTEDQLLAQQQRQGGLTDCALLGTDQQRSVLHGLDATQHQAFAYMPYGFRRPQFDVPGFNGEQPDPVTGHYLLGNGYRAFNPVLMRFNSPDSFSPFGKGGLNAYAYCVGDPVNRVDPTGHTPALLKFLLRGARLMKKSPRVTVAPPTSSLPASAAKSNRLIERIKPEPLKSPSEAMPGSTPRLTVAQTKKATTTLGNNNKELLELNVWIRKDVRKFGPATMDRRIDPEFYDMFRDTLTRRDNLLDENNLLSMKLGKLPEYDFASGLPRYTDVIDNVRGSR